MYEYYGNNNEITESDTFCWNKHIKDITIDDDIIEFLCDNDDIFYVAVSKEDLREVSDMDKNICSSAGFDCYNNKCLQHYPLQEITIEFNSKELINKTIIGFTNTGQHEFIFITKNNKIVPFIIHNNLPQYIVRLQIYPAG